MARSPTFVQCFNDSQGEQTKGQKDRDVDGTKRLRAGSAAGAGRYRRSWEHLVFAREGFNKNELLGYSGIEN